MSHVLGCGIPHYVDGNETNANWILYWLTGEGEASGYSSWTGGRGSDVGWFEEVLLRRRGKGKPGVPNGGRLRKRLTEKTNMGTWQIVIPWEWSIV